MKKFHKELIHRTLNTFYQNLPMPPAKNSMSFQKMALTFSKKALSFYPISCVQNRK